MTTYTNPYEYIYEAHGYDGVVRVSANGFYGSGVLLHDGQAVLTAAHLFDNTQENNIVVTVETAQGTSSINGIALQSHPQYSSDEGNHDLAIVWLEESAPIFADRYELYREDNEIGKDFVLVGYGAIGTGAEGIWENQPAEYLRIASTNTFDTNSEALKESLGGQLAWSPVNQLIADFDDGGLGSDALYDLLGINNLGTGFSEGLIAKGDSGGGAFVDGKVAGIASYVSALSPYSDIDNETNSSFGEIAAWQRVSQYQEWIDTSMHEHYSDAPNSAEEVVLNIQEGDDLQTTLAYFFVEFHGNRQNALANLSVDYATVDGTAKAGQDYLATEGTLMLYEGQTKAVIPVEIIGDNTIEEEETFYMYITNPIGASFPNDETYLSAMRTIVDDDGFI